VRAALNPTPKSTSVALASEVAVTSDPAASASRAVRLEWLVAPAAQRSGAAIDE
jgi:hypothetical protein